MKKFILRVILFFVIIAVIDIGFGMCCDYLYSHSKGGDTYKINYAISAGCPEVLIMGSSRANHHYNPQIITDSLGLTAYNLGIDGSGVILMDGFYRLIIQRYAPKCIIYELTPSFDFRRYDADVNNTRYLAQLKPYYRNECLSQLFDDIDPKERVKLHSGLYRYNTTFLNLIKFYLLGGKEGENGFTPLQGVMADYVPPSNQPVREIDSLKIKYLHHFINDCKDNGTELIFVISPRYGAVSSEEYQPGIDVCKKDGYEVWDYYCDPRFVSTREYFKDSYHLNSAGADAFTTVMVQQIKEVFLVNLLYNATL